MLAPRASKEDRAHLVVKACKRLRDARVIMEAQNDPLRRALAALAARILGGAAVKIVDERAPTICRLANVYLRVIDECAHGRHYYAVEIVDTLFTGMFSTVPEAKGTERDPVDLLDGFAGAAADYERNERAKSSAPNPGAHEAKAASVTAAAAAAAAAVDTKKAKPPKRARRGKEPDSGSDSDTDSVPASRPAPGPGPVAAAASAPAKESKVTATARATGQPLAVDSPILSDAVTLRPTAKRAKTAAQPAEETRRPSRRADTTPVPESKGSRTSARKEGGGAAPSIVVTPSLRRQLDRKPLPPAPTAVTEAAVETLTDSRGVKARVAQKGEKLPKLACIIMIED
jgi:hypothetical protein